MKSGKCPKCGSTEVYSGAYLPMMAKSGSYWGNVIPITGWRHAELDNFVCGNCGYTESYIAYKGKLNLLKSRWPRVQDGEYSTHTHRPPRETKTCPNCSSELDADWVACPYCGHPMV